MTKLKNDLFLVDEPKESLEKVDAFGHKYYAHTLMRMLESSSSNAPYSIGLFGDWGVGKTTIINELKRIISSNKEPKNLNFKIFILDVWEYSFSNFRREFLLDFATKIEQYDDLKDRLSLKKISQIQEPPKYDASWWKKFGLQLLIVVGVLFGGLLITKVLTYLKLAHGSEFIALTLMVFAAIRSGITENLKGLFKFEPTTLHVEPPIHPDEFRLLYKELLHSENTINGSNDRIVIVLDNLDRCEEATVIQLLGAVKTFLMEKQCVYILPCDDKGLKNHVISNRSGGSNSLAMSKSEANEYLRKFFKMSLTIRQLLTEELEEYISSILSGLEIFNESVDEDASNESETADIKQSRNIDEVSSIFRIAVWRNPRRVIQLANRLSSYYLLAQERGAEDSTLKQTIQSNLGFLSKLIVIEDEWPDFFSFLLITPDLMTQLNNHLIIEDGQSLPAFLEEDIKSFASELSEGIRAEWNSGLESFLRKTTAIHSDDVSDFLLFKRKPRKVKIPNYHLFRDAAINKEYTVITNTLDNEDADTRAIFEELIEILEFQINERHSVSNTVNALSSITRVFDKIGEKDETLKAQVADVVIEHASKTNILAKIMSIGLPELLITLHNSKKKAAISLTIKHLIDMLGLKPEKESISDEDKLIVMQLIANYQLISKKNMEYFKNKLKLVCSIDDQSEYWNSVAKSILEINPKLVNQLVPQDLFQHNIEVLATLPPEENTTKEFLKPFYSYFDSPTKNAYCSMIIEHLTDNGSYTDPLTTKRQNAIECLSDIPHSVLSEIHQEEIFSKMVEVLKPLTNENQKKQIFDLYYKFSKLIPPNVQSLYAPSIIQSIAAGDQAKIQYFIDHFIAESAAFDDISQIVEAINTRMQSFIGNKNLRLIHYNLLDTFDRHDLILSIAKQYWADDTHGESILEEIQDILLAEEFRGLIDELIAVSQTLPDQAIIKRFAAIGSYVKKYTLEYIGKLVSLLINTLLKHQQPSVRQGAASLWDGIKEKAKEEDVERFYDRINEDIKQSVNDNVVNEPLNDISVRVMVNNIGELPAKSKNEFADLMLRTIEDGRPIQVNTYGHGILRTLIQSKVSAKKIIRSVITNMQTAGEEVRVKNCLETLKLSRDILTDADVEKTISFIAEATDDTKKDEYQQIFAPSDT